MEKIAAINRLKWRSRRSMLELDLLFDAFIQSGGIDLLSDAELVLYHELLAIDDDAYLLSLLRGEMVSDLVEEQKLVEKIASSVRMADKHIK